MLGVVDTGTGSEEGNLHRERGLGFWPVREAQEDDGVPLDAFGR
jgi:hypothetical protein